jgi:hypothetical protein
MSVAYLQQLKRCLASDDAAERALQQQVRRHTQKQLMYVAAGLCWRNVQVFPLISRTAG